MKNVTRTICLTLTLFLGSVGTGCGPDFNKGVAAYESGDFATALGEFRPLAEQGDADAQYNLGVMYEKGRGVPQDDKIALKWFTLAAEQGFARAQHNLGVMYD
ncbi:MAG TPA: tetratricopeptide repeat protein, partial [Arenicellales bacterium]|nr:tetratricopeptide repeat protein [Arenicellales bacterium]